MQELQPVRYEPPPAPVWPCVIFDFDGTLCPTTTFDPFLVKSSRRPPLEEGKRQHERAKREGYRIVVVTVRAEFWRKRTEAWLAKHNFSYDALYMRDNTDRRSDVKVKLDLFDRIFEDNLVPVRAVEDNPFVAKLWESLGLDTVMVEEGNSWD